MSRSSNGEIFSTPSARFFKSLSKIFSENEPRAKFTELAHFFEKFSPLLPREKKFLIEQKITTVKALFDSPIYREHPRCSALLTSTDTRDPLMMIARNAVRFLERADSSRHLHAAADSVLSHLQSFHESYLAAAQPSRVDAAWRRFSRRFSSETHPPEIESDDESVVMQKNPLFGRDDSTDSDSPSFSSPRRSTLLRLMREEEDRPREI